MIGTKKMIAMVGGAAALAFAVGFGGVGVSPLGSTLTPTTHYGASVAPAPAQEAAPGVHKGRLTGLIAFGNTSDLHSHSHSR
jgi:hypothetical protein